MATATEPDRPTGLMPRGPDRRQAPQRAEDVALHYASAAMIDAGLKLAAMHPDYPRNDTPIGRLCVAADTYLEAEAAR